MTPDKKLESAVDQLGGKRSNDALAALGAAARAELGKGKPRAWWIDGVVLLVLNGVMGVAGAVLMGGNEAQHRSTAMKLVVSVMWFVFMAAGSLLWLKPGPVRVRWAVAGGFALASVLTVLGLSGFDPGGAFMDGMWCAIAECKMALLPVALVVIFSTRFAAQPMHLVAGALAAASGGAVALHFHCPNGTVAHVVVFHLVPALALAAVAVLARRWMKSSPVP